MTGGGEDVKTIRSTGAPELDAVAVSERVLRDLAARYDQLIAVAHQDDRTRHGAWSRVLRWLGTPAVQPTPMDYVVAKALYDWHSDGEPWAELSSLARYAHACRAQAITEALTHAQLLRTMEGP